MITTEQTLCWPLIINTHSAANDYGQPAGSYYTALDEINNNNNNNNNSYKPRHFGNCFTPVLTFLVLSVWLTHNSNKSETSEVGTMQHQLISAAYTVAMTRGQKCQ